MILILILMCGFGLALALVVWSLMGEEMVGFVCDVVVGGFAFVGFCGIGGGGDGL